MGRFLFYSLENQAAVLFLFIFTLFLIFFILSISRLLCNRRSSGYQQVVGWRWELLDKCSYLPEASLQFLSSCQLNKSV